MPSVITANALRSGAVVYLAHGGRWVSGLADAVAAATADDVKALEAIALAAVEQNVVTAVYAFDVKVVAGRPEPVSVRERIRAAQSATV